MIIVHLALFSALDRDKLSPLLSECRMVVNTPDELASFDLIGIWHSASADDMEFRHLPWSIPQLKAQMPSQ